VRETGGAIRPSLFYKDSCPPCRQLSRVAVTLSLGHVRRVPLSSEEANVLYQDYPDRRGQLMLRDGDDVRFGLAVLRALPRAVVRTWWRAARRAARVLQPGGGA